MTKLKKFTQKNFEYPIKHNLIITDFLKDYYYQKDDLNLNLIADNNKEALIMMGEAGWQ